MKISRMLETPSARIVLFLHNQGEVRYSKLAELIQSRGTLSLNLKHLEQEGLIKRRIATTKPIQSFYSLTEKGSRIARKFAEIRKAFG